MATIDTHRETLSSNPEDTTETTVWMRFARAGAVTIVVWSVVLQLIAGLIPPVALIGLVFFGFVPLLTGERRKLGLAFAVVALLVVAGNLPAVVDDLGNPDSAPAFILTLLAVVGAGIGTLSGLGAFFRWTTAPIRPVAVSAVVLFVAGTAASVVAAANTDSDEALADDVVVVAERIAWEPGEITLTAADGGVWVDNRDGIRHTFTVEELGIDLDVPGLKTRRVDVDAAPGTYEIICEVPGHESMTGTLVVEG